MQHKYIIFGFAVVVLLICLAYLFTKEREFMTFDFKVESISDLGVTVDVPSTGLPAGFVSVPTNKMRIDLTAEHEIPGYTHTVDNKIPTLPDGFVPVVSPRVGDSVKHDGRSAKVTEIVSNKYTIVYEDGQKETKTGVDKQFLTSTSPFYKMKVKIPTGYIINSNDNSLLVADPKYDRTYYSANLYQNTTDFELNSGTFADGAPGDGEYAVKKPLYMMDADGTLKTNTKADTEYANKKKTLPNPMPLGYERNPTTKTLDFNLTKYAFSKYSSTFDPNNLDTKYHDDISGSEDKYYQYNSAGQLIERDVTDASFSAAPVLYYVPGAYKFGSSNYVPNYEDSVYLSRTTRMPQTAPVYETAGYPGGFCNQYKGNKGALEEKCAALDTNTCASTSCCVLIGAQKCVAGNENGPTNAANYSDYNLRNRDFYYYNGKCYGNCTGNQGS